MKKLVNVVKWKWFPLIVAIALLVLVAGVALVMALFGWRFTYAPELENSWDAVSAVAAWVGVIVSVIGVVASFIAIWYAVQVPRKIADRQDKIALFEKRYQCYITIQNFLVCSEQIEQETTNKAIQTAFRIYFDEPEAIQKNEWLGYLIVLLKTKESDIIAGNFLFSNYNVTLLQDIINYSIQLLQSVAVTNEEANNILSTNASKNKEKFCQLCKQYKEEHLMLMEQELKLSLPKNK